MTPKTDKEISKDKRVEDMLGKRKVGGNPLFEPVELGFVCPICKKDKDVDSAACTLHFSEYKGFLWCKNCNIDIPSCLCKLFPEPNITDKPLSLRERVIEMKRIFLDTVEKARQDERAKLSAETAKLKAEIKEMGEELMEETRSNIAEVEVLENRIATIRKQVEDLAVTYKDRTGEVTFPMSAHVFKKEVLKILKDGGEVLRESATIHTTPSSEPLHAKSGLRTPKPELKHYLFDHRGICGARTTNTTKIWKKVTCPDCARTVNRRLRKPKPESMEGKV